jgi:flagellar biosynthetic protein FlhB
MVRETRNADVVVADHGRLAVALRYEPGRMRAPRVVACGARLHARRLCEIATEARIPVVQNPTVARSLQLRCDVGGEIPRALYETVAELLADVYRARAAARSSHVWPCSRSPRPRPVSTSIGTVKLGDE